MYVRIANRSSFAKVLGSSVIALTMSVGANAMQQEKFDKVEKVEKHVEQHVDLHHQHQEIHSNQSQVKSEPCNMQAGTKGCETQVKDDVPCNKQLLVKDCKTEVKSEDCGDQSLICESSLSFAQSTWLLKDFNKFFGADIQANNCANQASQFSQVQSFFAPNGKINDWHIHNGSIVKGSMLNTSMMPSRNWMGSMWSNSFLQKMNFVRTKSLNLNTNNVWIDGIFHHWNIGAAKINKTTFSGEYQDFDARNAKFKNVLIQNAQFSRHHLKHSNWNGSKFNYVHIKDTKLGGVQFHGAKLKDVYFTNITVDDHTHFHHAKVWNGTKYVKLDTELSNALMVELKNLKCGTFDLTAWMKSHSKSKVKSNMKQKNKK